MQSLPQRAFRRLMRAINGVAERRAFGSLKGIIHVGANTGQEAEEYARLGLNVLWIEPIPAIYASLCKNIAAFPNQRALSYLVLDRDGEERVLNVANNRGLSSSVLDLSQALDIWPDVNYVSQLKLTGWTLDSIVEREKIDASRYDGMVIDTQGTEHLVLKGSVAVLRGMKLVKAEVADFESYKGCARPHDLAQVLEPAGFGEYRRAIFAVHPKGGRYLDVIYTKGGQHP